MGVLCFIYWGVFGLSAILRVSRGSLMAKVEKLVSVSPSVGLPWGAALMHENCIQPKNAPILVHTTLCNWMSTLFILLSVKKWVLFCVFTFVFQRFSTDHYFLKITVSKPSWTDLGPIWGRLGCPKRSPKGAKTNPKSIQTHVDLFGNFWIVRSMDKTCMKLPQLFGYFFG